MAHVYIYIYTTVNLYNYIDRGKQGQSVYTLQSSMSLKNWGDSELRRRQSFGDASGFRENQRKGRI